MTCRRIDGIIPKMFKQPKILTLFLIFGFLTVVFLALPSVVMGHVDGMSGRCVTETAEGTNCPLTANPFVFANFHLDAAKGLVSGNVQPIVSIMAWVLLVVSLSIFSIFKPKVPILLNLVPNYFELANFKNSGHSYRERLFSLLAICEKRDPAPVF